MTNMKSILKLMAVGTAFAALAACTESEEGEDPYPLPDDVCRITLSETLYSDGGNVERTDVYTYDAGKRLVSHVTTQEMNHGQSLTHEVRFAYTGSQAICTDSNGNVATYLLDEEGRASQCTYIQAGQARNYQFDYDSNGYLKQIVETIEGETAPHSVLNLSYADGDLQTLSAAEVTLQYIPSQYANPYQLPDPMWENISPLSYHLDAIYAGLLGKLSSHLPAYVVPQGNEQEQTSYTYVWDENQLLAGINIETTYTGTVTDIYGNSSEEPGTLWRHIRIRIE